MNAISEVARKKLARRRSELTRLYKNNLDDEQQALADRPADWPDLAAERESAEVLGTLGERERAELVDIDAAMARLKSGTFGRCERCGGAIGRQRLLAVPQARYCVACETLVERGG